MFVLTVDQVGSRSAPDAVDAVIARLRATVPAGRRTGPVRTVGDEVQVVVTDAADALEIVLVLARAGGWSTGIGVGTVEEPLPRDVRAGRGPAFVAAREAVEAAKKRPTRFALRVADDTPLPAADLEPLIDLLLGLRARRTPEGWEVYDLLAKGLTQRQAAQRLRITAQSVSDRARAADLAVDAAARPALVHLLVASDTRRATG